MKILGKIIRIIISTIFILFPIIIMLFEESDWDDFCYGIKLWYSI